MWRLRLTPAAKALLGRAMLQTMTDTACVKIVGLGDANSGSAVLANSPLFYATDMLCLNSSKSEYIIHPQYTNVSCLTSNISDTAWP